jgi:IclR family acetate operon transcriptional repressor
MTNTPVDERYRVRSVDRALDVVEALAAGGAEGMTVSALARELGSSKSTVFSILQTLLARRFVADTGTGASRRYRLGVEFLRLGGVVMAELDLWEICAPVLRELTATTGATSRLGILDDTHAVVVSRIDAPHAVRFDLRMGKRELPHCTGVGKALLSALPERRVLDIVEAVGLPRRTRHTIASTDVLLKDLAATAARGYAIDDEEDADGIFCVGSPIFGHSGDCVGAVSMTALKLDIPAWRMHEYGETVREHADRITSMLGGPVWAERGAAQEGQAAAAG